MSWFYIVFAKRKSKHVTKERKKNLHFLEIAVQAFEPQHVKTTVHPAKTQISLSIRTVWSESLLCALWVAKDPVVNPRLIWVFAGHTGCFVCFVIHRLILFLLQNIVMKSFKTSVNCDQVFSHKLIFRCPSSWFVNVFLNFVKG